MKPVPKQMLLPAEAESTAKAADDAAQEAEAARAASESAANAGLPFMLLS